MTGETMKASDDPFDRKLIAPCGLYCGVCAVLIAHRDNNQKFKEKLTQVYGVSPEEIKCEGCLSENLFFYCTNCPIRNCAISRNYEGCYQCSAFPCEHVENFPLPVGKKVILRAVPAWKELGTKKWVLSEIERYHCPKCGYALFRGARRCRNCGSPVDVD